MIRDVHHHTLYPSHFLAEETEVQEAKSLFKIPWWHSGPGLPPRLCRLCQGLHRAVQKTGLQERVRTKEGRLETQESGPDTHLLLLLVEVVNDDTDEEVECEKGPEDDEDDEVEVHVEIHFILRLLLLL
jgi:hypothetical protein